MDMSIAAMSVNMNLAKTQQELGVSVLKMAMETETAAVEEVLETMESLDPALGQNIDLMA
ncbi:MAG: YjfB family protein [Selenomonadaceae bacterium]|nr:YjfB family protein [Selenomonadaceae bacterium]